MKKFFVILIPCIIGVVGAIGVYFLFFGKGKEVKETVKLVDTISYETSSIPSVTDGSIVYVELDSLTANYLMTEDLMAQLEEKMKKLDADFTNKQKVFQANVRDFENKANKRLETQSKLAEMQQQLAQDEQNLLQLRDRYAMEMEEERGVMQRKILQSIMDYLKEYNKEKGYKYILGNAFDAKILYADPSLDVTASVLDGLNAKYKAENKK